MTLSWNHLLSPPSAISGSSFIITLPPPKSVTVDHLHRHHRASLPWMRMKRRRLRIMESFICNSNSNLFHNLLCQFPPLNPFDLLAPALGFLSGLAIRRRIDSQQPPPLVSDVSDWILFTSPTPFNRFVTLRCPSLSISLVEDSHHDAGLAAVNRGRIPLEIEASGEESEEEQLVYQRACVSMDDGGVISLDWPANLDLAKEYGFDTTIVFVAGNAQGSRDPNVRSFVSNCLKRGCFPIVINPRGCAGSPLTTPRLFTAADSDDICTVIQFINSARPWTTLMGVGWGYGANMLTKYLAEVGELTPLTAATCIDNPFDLEEAARSSLYDFVDQNFLGGLIDILQSNKELFQGRAKGFDVDKALLARSVRDFEEATSMVSCGFASIEDFYAKSSTRDVVGNVKIPLLFVQSGNEALPLNSIPHNLIAENPFTSLLLCSCSPFNVITSSRSTVSWCQNLLIEWLTAVELGLLKGRHPLLEDVDFTINPSKGSRQMDSTSHKSNKMNNLLDPYQMDAVIEGIPYPFDKMLKKSNFTVPLYINAQKKDSKIEDEESKTRTMKQTNLVSPELVKEGEFDSVDSDRGQVKQTTQVVLNMLDVAMPDTLSEEQKNKVLTAVGQGESLMKALQDAVPEDVRGKLTNAVSAILASQKSNLKLDAVKNISQIPNVASGIVKSEEKVGLSSSVPGNENGHALNTTLGVNDPAEDSSRNQPNKDDSSRDIEPEPRTLGNSQKSVETSEFQLPTNHCADASNSGKKADDVAGSNYGSADFSREKNVPSFECDEADTEHVPEFSNLSERIRSSEVLSVDNKVWQEGETASSDSKEENGIQQKEENYGEFSSDQKKISSERTEEKVTGKEGSEHQKREEISAQPVTNQSSSISPTFSVSQALDALTGIDDSTQVAVNSVFSVIEDMITKFEVDREIETVTSEKNKYEDERTDTKSETDLSGNDCFRENKDDKTNVIAHPNKSADLQIHPPVGSENGSVARGMSLSNPVVPEEDHVVDCQEQSSGQHVTEQTEKWKPLGSGKLSAKNTDKVTLLGKNGSSSQHLITKRPYGDPLYDQYLRNYLVSKMKIDQSLDLDATTALFLDYIPEEGQWKLLEEAGYVKNSIDDVKTNDGAHTHLYATSADNIIEPAYVILDTEKEWHPVGGDGRKNKTAETVRIGDSILWKLMPLVRKDILESLKVEICRRVRATDMEEMAPYLEKELDHIANVISFTALHENEHIALLEGEDSVKVGTLHGEHIIGVISSAVQKTRYIRKVLPVGIIVGSSLAALRKSFDIVVTDVTRQSEAFSDQVDYPRERYSLQSGEIDNDFMPLDEVDRNNTLSSSKSSEKACEEANESECVEKNAVMVGAVTAALGASALFVHQQNSCDKGNEIMRTSSSPSIEKANQQVLAKLGEGMSGKVEQNIVSSLAEKAMSVAGPVVPTKDGEVDQERLVAMLADLGQKGGILKVIGKVALLWGGIRGAMSLTNKLISFLRMSERPLLQRILGFVCMVLVLWTPVVVPLLPTVVQKWATHSSSKIAEAVCIIGLYTSIMILLMLWGKRIRGYEHPLAQYGLDLASSGQIRNFLNGLIGGIMIVLLIHSLYILLGCASLSWPITPSADKLTLLISYAKVLRFVCQGLLTATGVALVEEMLFRSWLADEIAEDLGYHKGVILSGLVFSLSQRSIGAVPGLWLLSLGLAGVRQRSQGSLSLPIGLRAGIMASSYFLQMGGFLTYQPHFPIWFVGTRPFQPFGGIIGISVAILWAVLLYPRQPLRAVLLYPRQPLHTAKTKKDP